MKAKRRTVGIIGSGYIAKGLVMSLERDEDLVANWVFTRSSRDLRWDTNPYNYKCADGIFFDKLIEICGPIYPILEPLVVFGVHDNNLSHKDLEGWDFRW